MLGNSHGGTRLRLSTKALLLHSKVFAQRLGFPVLLFPALYVSSLHSSLAAMYVAQSLRDDVISYKSLEGWLCPASVGLSASSYQVLPDIFPQKFLPKCVAFLFGLASA